MKGFCVGNKDEKASSGHSVLASHLHISATSVGTSL